MLSGEMCANCGGLFRSFVIEFLHDQIQLNLLDVDVLPNVSVGRNGHLTVMVCSRLRAGDFL
jgi:hypothetical protein